MVGFKRPPSFKMQPQRPLRGKEVVSFDVAEMSPNMIWENDQAGRQFCL